VVRLGGLRGWIGCADRLCRAQAHNRPRRDCCEGSRSRRGLHAARRHPRRGSDCRKPLHTPGSDRVKRPDHGGPLFYGQYTSSDTGLIYLRARVYDPATAQFITVDPLAGITGEPYVYAGDNPTTLADPGGMFFGISGTPSFSEIGHTVTHAVVERANWAYNHSGEIATVASVASVIPGVDVVAAPVALIAGAVHTYQNVNEGNYVAAVFDTAGLFAGGLAMGARAESATWNEMAGELWSRGYMRPWALDEAARWASRYGALSAGSFAASLLPEASALAATLEEGGCGTGFATLKL
jgi:RHS repeat-associated protein